VSSPQKIRRASVNFRLHKVSFGISAEEDLSSAGINFSGANSGYNFARTKPIKPNAMKTIAKTLVAISILMISLPVLAGNNNPAPGQVHYKVQIHLQKDVPFRTNNVYVIITDERNQPVAPPQLFDSGKLTYEFTENNSVIGTREAQLMYFDGTRHRLFNSSPDIKSGKFITGETYNFNIYILYVRPGVGVE
jgi:hypothetical protein